MTSLRIAHLADSHLGYRALLKTDPETGRNLRALDIERSFATVVDDILTRDVDLVLHAGDVFHQTRPSWAAMRCFVQQMRRIEQAGIPAIVIGGNHDTPRLRTAGSVFSVLELALPGIQFVCEYEQREIDLDKFGLTVHAVPHGKLSDPLGASAFPVKNRRNILMTHGLTSDVELRGGHHEPGETEIASSLLDEEFEYIALGHYHAFHRSRANAQYSGASERIGFGDEDASPGYAIVDIGDRGTKIEAVHIPVEARAMKTIAPIEGADRDARDIADHVLTLLERAVDPETMARVEFRDTTRAVRREAEAILRKEAVPLCWSLSVFARSDVLLKPSERSVGSGATDVATLFDEFVGSRGYDAQFGGAFQTRGRAALEDAIRADDLQSGGDAA